MDPVSVGLGAASLLSGRFLHKRPNIGKINRHYLGQRPGGYLTAEDTRFVEGQRTKGLETVGVGAQQARQLAAQRLSARGIFGPASEQAASNITDSELASKGDVERNVSDLGYQIYGNNRDFEREKLMRAWGADLGDAQQGIQDWRSQHSGFWNSINEFLPGLMNLNNKSGGVTSPVMGDPGWQYPTG